MNTLMRLPRRRPTPSQPRNNFLDDWAAVHYLRLGTLFISPLRSLYGLLVLPVVIGLSYLPGFARLYTIGDQAWWTWIVDGLYIAWAIHFAAFAMRQDVYTVTHGNQVTQVKGNKSFTMYGIAIAVGLTAYLLGGSATPWVYLMAGFIQLLPLFTGNTLAEQAKQLGPLFTNVVLILTAMFYLAFG